MGEFVGRVREIRALDECLADAFAAHGKLVLFTGEPGIGKTRIAEELTRRAEAQGWTVAWGRAWEGEGTPAYFPWRQALRRLLPHVPAVFEATRAEHPELATILEPLAGRDFDAADPAEARFRLHDGVTELLRRASAERPLVIVLDDLHAADVSTLQLLHFVARNLRGDARVLLLATARDPAQSHAAHGPRLLAGVAREGQVIPLGRLSRAELSTWIEREAPELGTTVDRVLSISEGNPLFVAELLAAAQSRPGHTWSSAHALPMGIREAIRSHLEVISAPTQRVLELASVMGREISMAMLAELTTQPQASIEEAIGAGVLVVEDGKARVSFAHILMRDELYARLAPERRAELHRAVAVCERDPTHAAQHWIAGARATDIESVLPVLDAALRDAHRRLAFEDAAVLGQRAIDGLGALLSTRRICELQIAVGEAWSLAGDIDATRRAGAAAAAHELGEGGIDAVLLSRAALVHATEASLGARDEAAVRLLRDALAAVDPADSPMRAQVMARLSTALLPAPPSEHDEALAFAEQSIAMARRLGDEATLFAVLRFTRLTPAETDDARTRFALNAETIALAGKLGKTAQVASVLAWQVAACVELGDIDGAIRQAEAMEVALAVYRQPSFRWRAPMVRAMLADLEGRFAEADALSRSALALCEGHPQAMQFFLTQRMSWMITRGDDEGWAEFEPMVARVMQGGPLAELYHSLFDAMCGRVEKVRRAFTMLHELPLRALPDGGGLAWACAAVELGEYAAIFYEHVEHDERERGPWQFGPGRVTSMGPRAFVLGRLAVLLGRDDEALAHFDRARALAERLRARPFLAQIDLACARVLARRDPAAARERAEQARIGAAALGMARIEMQASGLLEGLAPGVARPSTGTTVALPQLTLAREGELWRLSADSRHVLLKHGKGLGYLELLVRAPCREIHVLEIVGATDDGDAGPMLDERAKLAYRTRAGELREELDEATANGDLGRAERARAELDALASELGRAVGLGGRDRRAVSAVERARINVQRRLRDVIGRVREVDPRLAEHLELSVRTGLFCMYLPVWAAKSS